MDHDVSTITYKLAILMSSPPVRSIVTCYDSTSRDDHDDDLCGEMTMVFHWFPKVEFHHDIIDHQTIIMILMIIFIYTYIYYSYFHNYD